ncbi:hypothetical protein PN462_09750 [Spirulina sp. CS-785/01]|nr:hypothetical protein [Spirulina sp. CS-785/01]MDB9313382.1 hypothetical protein [Spirulina sp. CS-785/01]
MENISTLDLLFVTAIALLIVISGGIVYLSAVEWRDRRRRKQDEKMKK